MADREKVISKLEKEVQRTYSTKTTVFQNGEKVSEEINTHREPCVRIPIEIADKILALLKEQEAVKRSSRRGTNGLSIIWTCGKCGADLEPNNAKAKYCSNCGQAVKWE